MSNDPSCMCMYLTQVWKSVAEVDIVAEEMAGAELLRSPLNLSKKDGEVILITVLKEREGDTCSGVEGSGERRAEKD